MVFLRLHVGVARCRSLAALVLSTMACMKLYMLRIRLYELSLYGVHSSWLLV